MIKCVYIEFNVIMTVNFGYVAKELLITNESIVYKLYGSGSKVFIIPS